MKIVAILSKFGIKRVIFVEKLPILWSVEDFVEILWSAKFFSLLYGPQVKKVWETLPKSNCKECKNINFENN